MSIQFTHVANPRVRSFLEGDISEDALCIALNATSEALREDEANNDLPPDVLGARRDACEDALFAWNEEGDVFESLEALRRFWTV